VRELIAKGKERKKRRNVGGEPGGGTREVEG